MPSIATEFGCAICEQTTGQINRIMAAGGILTCAANSAHRWNDTQEFFNSKPKVAFKPEMMKPLPQEHHTPVTVSMPLGVKAALETKYGEKLSATVASVMSQMAEENYMLIPEVDINRMTDKLGARPRNSSELYGMIFAMMAQVDDAKQERDEAVRNAKAYEGISPGRVVLDLGGNFQTALSKANDASLPLALWLGNQVRAAIENNWF